MKFPFRFSIAVLLTVVAMAAGFLAGYQGTFRVPAKFEGVWRIRSATNDGEKYPLAIESDGSLSQGECGEVELIFSGNRLVVVSTDGRGGVCEMSELPGSSELKLELKGFGFSEDNDPAYAIVKRSGSDLIFAWVDFNATRIDNSIGGQQIVYTATRPTQNGK